METVLPAPSPEITPETEAFWQATTEGRLLLPRCPRCEDVFWYPRGICPTCLHTPVEWVEAPGRGTIYSYTVLRRPVGPYREVEHLVIAYVELEDGPRILTNIVVSDPDTLHIGQRVQLVFSPTSSSAALYRFEVSA